MAKPIENQFLGNMTAAEQQRFVKKYLQFM